MTKNEQDFINYYFHNVVGKSVGVNKINEAYFILRGDKQPDNCINCVKQRKQKLDNTYISLIKLGGPVLDLIDEKIIYQDNELDFQVIEQKKPIKKRKPKTKK